jgi:murein DD-endopeptidase MepM/ murein hydrolase activator NlpD
MARYEATAASNLYQQQLEAQRYGKTRPDMYSTNVGGYQVPMIDERAAGTMSTQEYYDYLADLKRAKERGTDIYGQQQSLADILRDRAAGVGGPSLAQMQLAQTTAQQQRDLAGNLSAMGRSVNPAVALEALLQRNAQARQMSAGEGAMLRAKEQMEAQKAYADQLASMRGSETTGYQNIGSLQGAQDARAIEIQEAQKARDLKVAEANAKAVATAQGIALDREKSQNELAGSGLKAATAGLTAAQGGMIRRRYADGGEVCAADGGKISGAKKKMYADGGTVKAAMGHLAKMDSEKNDTVPAMLSPGEIVIPRSVVNSPDPVKASGKFVEAILKNVGKKDAKQQALKVALSSK